MNRDIHLDINDEWGYSDKEFTHSKTSIHAVWPRLRHGNYSWKVISGTGLHQWAYTRRSEGELRFENFGCNSPVVLACGVTTVSFIFKY